MHHVKLRQWIALVITSLALTAGACDPLGERVVSPASHSPSAQMSNDWHSFQLIEGVIPTNITTLQVSQLIGPLGGSLSLAGHVLTVPAGAVTAPTLFAMTLGTRGYVEVGLTATREILGTVVDIGSQGFANGKTVTLSLTYAWATNVSNPANLFNVRELANDELQALDSEVDEGTQHVTTELEHLSSYAMAE